MLRGYFQHKPLCTDIFKIHLYKRVAAYRLYTCYNTGTECSVPNSVAGAEIGQRL